jgi:hypothetical protein
LASQQLRDSPHPHFRFTTLRQTASSGNSTVPSATHWSRCARVHTSKWRALSPLVLWADRATTRKSASHSPFLWHRAGPSFRQPKSSLHAHANSRNAWTTYPTYTSEYSSTQESFHFGPAVRMPVREHDRGPQLQPGVPILVRNAGADLELGRKTKPRYSGPMAVIRRSRNGTYSTTSRR